MANRDEEYTAYVAASWSRLFRTAWALTGNYSEAEDMLQAALTKVYVSWNRVTKADLPDAYVRRILVNQVVSWRRRPSLRSESRVASAPDRGVPGHEDQVTESDAMWQALGALPPRQRAVIVLRYYEGLSEREIAEVLDIAAGTVKSQCSAGLAKLRATLGATAVDTSGGSA